MKRPQHKKAVGAFRPLEHGIDDNFIALRDSSHRPEAFVGLWKEGEATELIEELLLQVLKLPRFNGPAVVVTEGDEEVIFFHQS
jgi:hypothetical protein